MNHPELSCVAEVPGRPCSTNTMRGPLRPRPRMALKTATSPPPLGPADGSRGTDGHAFVRRCSGSRHAAPSGAASPRCPEERREHVLRRPASAIHGRRPLHVSGDGSNRAQPRFNSRSLPAIPATAPAGRGDPRHRRSSCHHTSKPTSRTARPPCATGRRSPAPQVRSAPGNSRSQVP